MTLIRLADLRRESALESFSAGQFMRAGLPQPEHQVRIPTPFGDFYPDSLWRAQRLIGEADGQGKYADPESVTREKLRDGYLIDKGYGLLHWTGREMLGTPGRVVDRAAGLLLARGWDGIPQEWVPLDG